MNSQIVLVIGTRPELIKMAPLIIALKGSAFKNRLCIVNTGQHKELLDPYWNIFNIKPDYTLDIMLDKASLSVTSSRALIQLQDFIEKLEVLPRVIIAQGDTITVMISSMAAFFNKIEFIHLEAGLRSFDFNNPFPEEYNRKVAAISCGLHLAPTYLAKQNLLNEGYIDSKIVVVGNTVVDALHYIRSLPDFVDNNNFISLQNEFVKHKFVLITCHRRENHGQGINNILEAVEELVAEYSDYAFIWSLHPNPNVQEVVEKSKLNTYPNFKAISPLNYIDLLALMSHCVIIISDSGGIQEEAPSFNVPVLVLREKTERPEGIDSGIAFLVGTDKYKIVNKFRELVVQAVRKFHNPYGDGTASFKIVELLISKFEFE